VAEWLIVKQVLNRSSVPLSVCGIDRRYSLHPDDVLGIGEQGCPSKSVCARGCSEDDQEIRVFVKFTLATDIDSEWANRARLPPHANLWPPTNRDNGTNAIRPEEADGFWPDIDQAFRGDPLVPHYRFIVSPLIPGLDLCTFRGADAPPVLVEAVCGLLHGLAALHAADLVHCDIKPDNIVLSQDDNQIRIIDFAGLQQRGSCRKFTVTWWLHWDPCQRGTAKGALRYLQSGGSE
jgi:hypothetical protein